MASGYTVLGPDTLQNLHDPMRDFAYEVLVGLSESPRRLSSRYFYDDAGSRYFSRIMLLDEDYPTRCETEVLELDKSVSNYGALSDHRPVRVWLRW